MSHLQPFVFLRPSAGSPASMVSYCSLHHRGIQNMFSMLSTGLYLSSATPQDHILHATLWFQKGSSAVPIREPFLLLGTTLFSSRYNPFGLYTKVFYLEPKGFYSEPKTVLQKVLLRGQLKYPLRF